VITMVTNVDDALLAAYVDGELCSEQLEEVEQFLGMNEEARRKVTRFREMTALLRTTCAEQRFLPPPPAFMALAAPRKPTQAKSQWLRHTLAKPWMRMALAASLLLLAFTGGLYMPNGKPGQPPSLTDARTEMLNEIAEYHIVYARETEHLVEVPAERKSHIEEWLGARLKREIDIPDLMRQGLEFAGARMLVLEGNPVAQLIYTRESGAPIGLCITFGEMDYRPFAVEKHHGINVGHWTENGYTYVIVGAMPKDGIWHIATAVDVQL